MSGGIGLGPDSARRAIEHAARMVGLREAQLASWRSRLNSAASSAGLVGMTPADIRAAVAAGRELAAREIDLGGSPLGVTTSGEGRTDGTTNNDT